MRSLFVLAAPLVVPMLVGCGASLPGEREGEEAVKAKFAEKRDMWGQMKFVSFHKTNGIERGDHTAYRMEGETNAELAVGGWWPGGGWGGVLTNKQEVQLLHRGSPAVRIGQPLRKVPTMIEFEKTDKGWRPATADLDWGEIDKQLKAR